MPVGASTLRSRTVRDFLERNVPRWSSMRCYFLLERAHGSECFFRVEGDSKARSTGDVLEVPL